MRVIIFGATGMVGRGVLRECLLDERVTAVLTVGRSPTGTVHPKLRELLHSDLSDLSAVEDELSGYDACFFCLGVSAAGMSEQEYRRVTYDYTLAAGTTLARLSPSSTFVYVSGAGTDAHGRAMWARVKGATENALLALPFHAYMFRPGYIQPMHGVTSRTRWYRLAYVVAAPLYPLLRRLFPASVTTTERIGQAMITVAERGAPERILGPAAINAL
ncbi:NAD-dependent epimerase/dehydratase family protein [Nonomuraea sp. NPDC003560]|uniref:NAD-dependent epimerase/dehydratase family protein n=1 Tax=Nonomuraea sp. NPDC003560 TaxID=3364341 RepID=UPI0036826813